MSVFRRESHVAVAELSVRDPLMCRTTTALWARARFGTQFGHGLVENAASSDLCSSAAHQPPESSEESDASKPHSDLPLSLSPAVSSHPER